MDSLKNGWFSELSELWPGQCMSLEVEKVLYHEKSKFQDILVFKSKTYGNVLVLDGVIQVTERDEHSYQEMLAHIPLFCHPNPKKVLIIGGGDGGVAREVLKHPEVESVDMCEIDEKVPEVSKKFLPTLSTSFSNPKFKLHVQDGFEYMKQHQQSYDVIITDSSDPIGNTLTENTKIPLGVIFGRIHQESWFFRPASSLFEKSYYEHMEKSLKPGGILSSQGECTWLHLNLIKGMLEFCKTLFPTTGYSYTCIPTYPSGQIGFILCSKSPDVDLKNPVKTLSKEEVKKMDLKYYNSEIHKSSFVLPEFARKALE